MVPDGLFERNQNIFRDFVHIHPRKYLAVIIKLSCKLKWLPKKLALVCQSINREAVKLGADARKLRLSLIVLANQSALLVGCVCIVRW